MKSYSNNNMIFREEFGGKKWTATTLQAWTSWNCVPLQVRLRMIAWDFLISLFQQTSAFFFLRLLRFLSFMLPTATYEAFCPPIPSGKIGNTSTTWSTFHDSYVWWRSLLLFLVPLSIRFSQRKIRWNSWAKSEKKWQVTNPPIDPIREAVVMSLGGGALVGWFPPPREWPVKRWGPTLGWGQKTPSDLLEALKMANPWYIYIFIYINIYIYIWEVPSTLKRIWYTGGWYYGFRSLEHFRPVKNDGWETILSFGC